jgi:predicted TPR repeat methyltransferase
MPEMVKVVTTDAEIDAAIQRARAFEKYDRRAVSATYSKHADVFLLQLQHGVTYSIPRRLIQGLRDAKVSDLQKIELLGNGTGIHWPSLDVGHSVHELLAGVFGSAQWMKQLEAEAGRDRMTA